MIQPHTVCTAAKLLDAAGAIQKVRSAWFRGAPALWRVLVLNPDGTVADISAVTKINVSIVNSVNGAPGDRPYLSHQYFAADFNAAATMAQWEAREAWHFAINFTAEDMLLPVKGVSTPYWLILEAFEGDDEPLPLTVLQIDLRSPTGGGLDHDPLAPDGALLYDGAPITFGGHYILA